MAADLDNPSNNIITTPRTRIRRTIGIHGGNPKNARILVESLLVEGSILDPSVDSNNEVFDPWGRPGAGAPIKNDNGQVVTATQNHFNDKKQVTKH